ncbi:MAG: DJ-1 family glyoxalase III, partial [Bradyrhizobium sp.]
MARAVVLLADGFEDIEALSCVDVLRRGQVETVTAAVGARRQVVSAHGVRIEADALVDEIAGEVFDAVILPGGARGAELLGESDAVLAMLAAQKRAGRFVCAICAAPIVLVKAGLVDEGQHLTCYPSCAVDLDRPCANVPAVRDGNLITGQAPGSALLFALIVLEALAGEPVARRVANAMVTD